MRHRRGPNLQQRVRPSSIPPAHRWQRPGAVAPTPGAGYEVAVSTDRTRHLNRATVLVSSLDRAPRSGFMAISVMLAVLIGVVDWATGPDLSLIIFYLVPVLIAAWILPARVAVALAVVIALEWLAIAVLGPDSGAPDLVLVWNAIVRLGFFLLVVWLVVEQRHLLIELERHATTDPLTGALNRRAFVEAAERELARARRRGEVVTVLYLDLDGLKEANDTIGHEAGDQMIERTARTAREVLRAEDLFARAGGDEFVGLLPGADQDEGVEVARRLLERLAADAEGPPVALSAGAWTVRTPDDGIEVLLQHADRCMYEAKRAGGGDVVSATPQDRHRAADTGLRTGSRPRAGAPLGSVDDGDEERDLDAPG